MCPRQQKELTWPSVDVRDEQRHEATMHGKVQIPKEVIARGLPCLWPGYIGWCMTR